MSTFTLTDMPLAGTDTLSIVVRSLYDAMRGGYAIVEGIDLTIDDADRVREEPQTIGFALDGGLALHSRAVIAVVQYWQRTRYRTEWHASVASVGDAFRRAGLLTKTNTGRRDYQVRRGDQRVRVWCVPLGAIGIQRVILNASTHTRSSGDDVATSAARPEVLATARHEGDVPPVPRPARYYRDGFGFYIPQALSSVDARMIEVLRFVGRIRYATRPYIARFAYPDKHDTTAFRAIRYLVAHDLLWEVPGRQAEFMLDLPVQAASTPQGKRPTIYGLTERGKAWLIERERAMDDGVEADERHARVLKERDLVRRPLPSRTMSHDMQVAWWLASALTALKYNQWCHSVYVETEFIVNEHQRIDAYLDIRFDLTTPRTTTLRMPWNQGDTPGADERSVKIALEIDNSTEAPRIIYLKGWTYANLTYNQVYDWVFRGPILPVFIAPTVERKATIMHEFAQIWPLNWGICATSKRCHDPMGGTLWGTYHRMNDLPLDTPPEELPVLTVLTHSADGTVTWRPAITAEQWVLGMVNPRTGQRLVDEKA
jgi:hypothetical protein